jgi:hypothetical protein
MACDEWHMQRYTDGAICTCDETERFHNPCTLFGTVKGAFTLREKALESRGFEDTAIVEPLKCRDALSDAWMTRTRSAF